MKSTKVVYELMPERGGKPPKQGTPGSAGFDVFADLTTFGDEVMFAPSTRRVVPTGLRFDIPEGYEIQVRSRSGLAAKKGLMVLNSPGTIDSDYTGELMVILANTDYYYPCTVKHGDAIAQIVVKKVPSVKMVPGIVDKQTERGEGGFGSTGE